MEPVTSILGGIVIAGISAATGKYIGSNGKMSDRVCKERQHACVAIVIEKVDNLVKVVDRLEKTVNDKLLSL